VGGIGIRIAVVGVIVVGGFLFRDYLTGGADDLRVGDCFEEPAAAQTIEDVQHKPCGDPHDNEVIHVAEYPASADTAEPSDDAYELFIYNTCGPVFASYTGLDLLTSETLSLAYYVPASDAWADGNRKVICYAYHLSGTKLTGSVKQ
jgi:hypothetical protein